MAHVTASTVQQSENLDFPQPLDGNQVSRVRVRIGDRVIRQPTPPMHCITLCSRMESLRDAALGRRKGHNRRDGCMQDRLGTAVKHTKRLASLVEHPGQPGSLPATKARTAKLSV